MKDLLEVDLNRDSSLESPETYCTRVQQAVLKMSRGNLKIAAFFMRNLEFDFRIQQYRLQSNLATFHRDFGKIAEYDLTAIPSQFPGRIVLVRSKRSGYVEHLDLEEFTKLFPQFSPQVVYTLDTHHWLHFDMPTETVRCILNLFKD